MRKLTDLQNKILLTVMSSGEITVKQLATKIYANVRKDLRPINPSNSILKAIDSINVKRPGKIKTLNRGCKGKLLYV